MTGAWIYPSKPINGAQELDFAARMRAGTDVVGQQRTEALCGFSELSPGDWTLYLLRKTWTQDAGFVDPADVRGWIVQSGTDKGRADVLGLESCISTALNTQILARLYRGVAIHIAAGTVDVAVTYVPTGRLEDDRLLAWVAPGRPSPYFLAGAAAANVVAANVVDRVRIPPFALAVRTEIQTPDADLVAPQIVWWRNTNVVGVADIPAGTAVSSTRWMVPERVTHMSYRDLGVGALSQSLIFEVECFG